MFRGFEINKIYRSDCIEGMRKLPDKSVDLTLTDIPYGAVSKNGAERAKYVGQLRKIDKGLADIVTFELTDFLREVSRVTNGGVYIFCGVEQVSTIFSYFDSHKDFMVRQCAWRKTNPAPSNGQHMWLSTMENCIFAKRRKTKFNALCRPSVWDFPISRGKLHPTQKSLDLFEYLTQASTDEGDLILDPCMGSGTTAVAAVKLNRNFIGFEIEREYVDIANKRLNGVQIELLHHL